jgi:hypothetical protein
MAVPPIPAHVGYTGAYLGAFKKGWTAVWSGVATTCPYRDWRNGRGGITFARAFRRAWIDGYTAGLNAGATPRAPVDIIEQQRAQERAELDLVVH